MSIINDKIKLLEPMPGYAADTELTFGADGKWWSSDKTLMLLDSKVQRMMNGVTRVEITERSVKTAERKII